MQSPRRPIHLEAHLSRACKVAENFSLEAAYRSTVKDISRSALPSNNDDDSTQTSQPSKMPVHLPQLDGRERKNLANSDLLLCKERIEEGLKRRVRPRSERLVFKNSRANYLTMHDTPHGLARATYIFATDSTTACCGYRTLLVHPAPPQLGVRNIPQLERSRKLPSKYHE